MSKFYIKLINFLLLIIFGEHFFHEDVFNESILNEENIHQKEENNFIVDEETDDSFSKKKKIFTVLATISLITVILVYFYYNSQSGNGSNDINGASLDIINHTITENISYLNERILVQDLLLKLSEVANWEFFCEVDEIATKAFDAKNLNDKIDSNLDFQICLKKFLFNSESELINNPNQSEQIVMEIAKIIDGME